jgi:hypothetical protein
VIDSKGVLWSLATAQRKEKRDPFDCAQNKQAPFQT